MMLAWIYLLLHQMNHKIAVPLNFPLQRYLIKVVQKHPLSIMMMEAPLDQTQTKTLSLEIDQHPRVRLGKLIKGLLKTQEKARKVKVETEKVADLDKM